ncbi:hypothetical protein [Streptomyces sp. NPDC004976]
MSDADRLARNFADLVQDDNEGRIGIRLETRALAHAQHALDLQVVGQASTRVRHRLYYLAAAFTGTALWAAVEAQEPQRAQKHLNKAMMLAGMAGSSEMHMRLWGHAALLAFQQQHMHDALAAAEAGRRAHVCRSDALFRSLASARFAGILSAVGENAAALRTLEHAEKTYVRADKGEQRPTWMSFYDLAELNGLAALVMSRVGRHEEAEARLHRTLALLRPDFHRNRVYYTIHLALAQLAQDEADQAVNTALPLLSMESAPLAGRSRSLLHHFDHKLRQLAPGAHFVIEWQDRLAEGKKEL